MVRRPPAAATSSRRRSRSRSPPARRRARVVRARRARLAGPRSAVRPRRCPSAAVASPSDGRAAVPPSSESRSMASDVYPSAASRGGIERMWAVRPRFSWITRTAPLRIRRGREHADQLTAWAGEADLLGDRAGRGFGRRHGITGTVSSTGSAGDDCRRGGRSSPSRSAPAPVRALHQKALSRRSSPSPLRRRRSRTMPTTRRPPVPSGRAASTVARLRGG